MKKNELEKRIREEEDFIHSPKHQNSLTRFFMKNDQPLENGAIGRLLLISSKEVEAIYQESVVELRKQVIQSKSSE
jgi:hypothetical protein